MKEKINISDRYPDAIPVLATGSTNMIDAYRSIYREDINNLNPEGLYGRTEPLTGAIAAALFKIREVAEVVPQEYLSDVNRTAIVIGSDVEFIHNGKPRHKESRNGELTKKEIKRLKKKAKKWYREPFTARWIVAFAAEVISHVTTTVPEERKIAQFEIEADFPKGIKKEIIGKRFNTNSNALIELAEAGVQMDVQFRIKHLLDQSPISLNHELATMLIRDKLLPPAIMKKFIDEQSETKYRDEYGVEWGVLGTALLTALSKS